MAIHLELEQLYLEDHKERSSKTNTTINQDTARRIQRLKQIIPSIDTTEIWNCHYLAYLLQHSDDSADYKLAHEYAKKAIEMGSTVTKWLYAATQDRYLLSQGKKQKYGTQFIKKGDVWEMAPFDNSITDAERAKYFVPPISDALKVFTEKYK